MSAVQEQVVEIPYVPRSFQREVHQKGDHARFGVIVCHRRFGKTVMGVNQLQKGAVTCEKPRPRFAYIGPTYRQSKQVAWDYAQYYARPIPNVGVNQSELRIDYPNHGQVRLYGSDNPDSLRGIYLDGALLDEYGLHPAKTFSEVIGATLVDRGGWAWFCGTPNGKNQFYEMAQHAQREQAAGNPQWFYVEYKASQTGLLDPAYLEQAKAVMTEDEYQQEFECSFTAAVKGAIFSREMAQAQTEGRITSVPYDPALPVDTTWDLGFGGKGDSTAIWFTQSLRNHEIRVIDYVEAQGEGLPYYAAILQQKRYVYGTHWAPHDIIVKESTGKTRIETAAQLGIAFQIVPNVGIEDGIHAARMIVGRCWFDREKCAKGLEALQHYRRDYNERLNEFKASPVHDWACVTADTEVLTRSGTHQIQYLPRTGEVWTACGWKTYENPRITRRAAPLVAVTFDDGLTVRCTPEHRFLTDSGWIFASDLQTGSLIRSSLTHSRNILTDRCIAFGRKSATTLRAGFVSTVRSGQRRLARFRTVAISIIETATLPIIQWLISNAFPRLSTCLEHGTPLEQLVEFTTSLPPQDYARLSGTHRTQDGYGIDGMPSAARAGRNGSAKKSHADTAVRRCWRWFGNLGILKNIARKPARPLRIASVIHLSERCDVWCLTVPDGHQWSLANGAITHNSHGADAFRYLAVRYQPPDPVRAFMHEPSRMQPGPADWMFT